MIHSSRGQKALVVFSAVSTVLGIVIMGSGVAFAVAPKGISQQWADVYPLFKVFRTLAFVNGTSVIMTSFVGVFGVLFWVSAMRLIHILFSALCVIINTLSCIIPFVFAGLSHIACNTADDECVKCDDTSSSYVCTAVATSYGKSCFYTHSDYEVVCVDVHTKLLLAASVMIISAVLSLIVSIMGCMTRKKRVKQKKRQHLRLHPA